MIIHTKFITVSSSSRVAVNWNQSKELLVVSDKASLESDLLWNIFLHISRNEIKIAGKCLV